MNILAYYVFRRVAGEGNQYMDKYGRWVDSIRSAEVFETRHKAMRVVGDYLTDGAQLGRL